MNGMSRSRDEAKAMKLCGARTNQVRKRLTRGACFLLVRAIAAKADDRCELLNRGVRLIDRFAQDAVEI